MADQSASSAPAAETRVSPADAPEPLADSEQMSLEEARKLRKEHATLRRRLNETEAELQQHKQAGLSELERAQAEIQRLTARSAELDRLTKERAVERLLHGAEYPDLLLAQVPWDQVTLDDDGTVLHGERLVARLQKAYPRLWSAGSADGGARGPAAVEDMNDYIRRRVGRR